MKLSSLYHFASASFSLILILGSYARAEVEIQLQDGSQITGNLSAISSENGLILDNQDYGTTLTVKAAQLAKIYDLTPASHEASLRPSLVTLVDGTILAGHFQTNTEGNMVFLTALDQELILNADQVLSLSQPCGIQSILTRGPVVIDDWENNDISCYGSTAILQDSASYLTRSSVSNIGSLSLRWRSSSDNNGIKISLQNEDQSNTFFSINTIGDQIHFLNGFARNSSNQAQNLPLPALESPDSFHSITLAWNLSLGVMQIALADHSQINLPLSSINPQAQASLTISSAAGDGVNLIAQVDISDLSNSALRSAYTPDQGKTGIMLADGNMILDAKLSLEKFASVDSAQDQDNYLVTFANQQQKPVASDSLRLWIANAAAITPAADAHWLITLDDGSLLPVSSFQNAKEQLVIQHPLLGEIRVDLTQIQSIAPLKEASPSFSLPSQP